MHNSYKLVPKWKSKSKKYTVHYNLCEKNYSKTMFYVGQLH